MFWRKKEHQPETSKKAPKSHLVSSGQAPSVLPQSPFTGWTKSFCTCGSSPIGHVPGVWVVGSKVMCMHEFDGHTLKLIEAVPISSPQ